MSTGELTPIYYITRNYWSCQMAGGKPDGTEEEVLTFGTGGVGMAAGPGAGVGVKLYC